MQLFAQVFGGRIKTLPLDDAGEPDGPSVAAEAAGGDAGCLQHERHRCTSPAPRRDHLLVTGVEPASEFWMI